MKPLLLVHGGAGDCWPEDEGGAKAQAGCLAAAQAGLALLRRGKSALDAVAAAVQVLENDPRFNAGFGSALTSEGTVEMDASIMDGSNLDAGAVTGVRHFANPIQLARAVMERTPHVFLAGAGAEALATEAGLPRVDNHALITPRALAHHQAGKTPAHGTVGAVAVDERGHVAAATSTGGTSGKRPGRIGDSPLIGAGTYADDLAGASSCTGLGEAIIRVTLARHAVDLARGAPSAQAAAWQALASLKRGRGTGGLILVTPTGAWGVAHDTPCMSHAWADGDGQYATGYVVQDLR